MISDVLLDASSEIDRYRTQSPDMYGEPEIAAALDELQGKIGEVIKILNAPPEGVEKVGVPG